MLRSPTPTAQSVRWHRSRLPGLLLAALIAVVATAVGQVVPLVGGPVFAVLVGALVGVCAPKVAHHPAIGPGLTTASRLLLQCAVVLLGAQLSIRQVVEVGASGLPVMIGTLVAALAGAALLGRALRVDSDLRTLIGVGTAICGASAIAAVTPVLRPTGTKVTYALSTVFVFNIAAVLALPPLGHLLGMSPEGFGLLAGTAVNDMSSVVAAATSFGDGAADTAVVVKLTRTLAIIPIVAILAALVSRRDRLAADPAEPGAATSPRLWRLVPWFLVGFLAVAGGNGLGLIPAAAQPTIASVAAFLITMALAAIGLGTDLPALRRAGATPLLLGGLLWLIVMGTSLGLQGLLGTLV
ncbi:YeiH family protein [Occultella gossypii]|uniref:Sulfate exporter family transporter n=1 Tax=Occultella gossypii TaxID=2800820 RepID=A0ABS7S8Q0_9MICO|nr:putative sulfate exporter family transporter [Occultella gossypii]MBZ2196724.1 putative sulfate exporter family transporter [Occultella gossypii]